MRQRAIVPLQLDPQCFAVPSQRQIGVALTTTVTHRGLGDVVDAPPVVVGVAKHDAL